MKREKHIYTLPVAVRNPTVSGAIPEKIGLKELTIDEEERAIAGVTAPEKVPYRLLKASLAWVKYEDEEKGHELNLIEAEDEQIYASLSAPARSLLVQAFNQISSPSSEDRDSFLKSLEVIS